MKARAGIITLPGGTRLSAVTIDLAVEQFAARIRARGKAINTVKAYCADLADLQGFCATQGITLVGLISDRTLEHWLDDMTARGLERRTQARKLTAVRMFLKHARVEGWIQREYDPAKEVRVSYKPARVIAPELDQLLEMIEGIAVVGDTSRADLAAIRDKAMLRLALDSGLRIGEVAALDMPGEGAQFTVDLKRRLVHVPRKGGGVDTIAIDTPTCAVLERWLGVRERMAAPDSSALFVSQRGRRFSRAQLHVIVGKRGEQAGLKGLHWHLLRHRRIGQIYEALGGKVAQDHARHAHLSTTENVYGAHASKVSHQLIRERAPLPEIAA